MAEAFDPFSVRLLETDDKLIREREMRCSKEYSHDAQEAVHVTVQT